jgi:hypothetical protein
MDWAVTITGTSYGNSYSVNDFGLFVNGFS